MPLRSFFAEEFPREVFTNAAERPGEAKCP